MEPAPKLFRSDIVATATALPEPSMCLVECGESLGLLVAESSSDSSRGFILEGVSYLRVHGADYRYRDLEAVVLRQERGVWVIQDLATSKYVPRPSDVPYSVLYLPDEDLAHLRACRAANEVEAVFHFCQPRFGSLPGFAYKGNLLVTPNGYAESQARVRGQFLIPRAGL